MIRINDERDEIGHSLTMATSDVIVIAKHTMAQFGENALFVLEKRVAGLAGAEDPLDLEARLLWRRVLDAVRELNGHWHIKGTWPAL